MGKRAMPRYILWLFPQNGLACKNPQFTNELKITTTKETHKQKIQDNTDKMKGKKLDRLTDK